MSVDPLVQAPTNSQSINPYSYIMNNPLSGTDPTGYCSTTDTMKDCAGGLEEGKTQAITNADGDTVGYVGKDSQGNVHITNNGASKGQTAVANSIASVGKTTEINSQISLAQSNNTTNDNVASQENTQASATTMGGESSYGGSAGIPNSGSSEGNAEGGAGEIISKAGKFLIKLGKGGNIILMAITPAEMGDGTLDLSNIRTSDEQKDDLWYHYTDEKGLKQIISDNYTIKPKGGLVYLTKFEYSRELAKQALFMGGYKGYENKGSHVLIFSLNKGVHLEKGTQPNEWIHQGRMRLGREIKQINYADKNPF